MLRTPVLVSALALFACLAGPAHAAPQADQDVITVTGTVMNEEEARARSRAHVAAVLGTPVSGQNARWASPLCIAIVGAEPASAVPILNRIESIVTNAGAELGRKGCRPNVVMHFTANADTDLAAIDRKRPDLLEELPEAERRRLRTAGLPVRWFYGDKVDGVGARQLDEDLPSGDQLAGYVVLREGGASRITTPIEVRITSATVLVDAPRVAGVPVKALADYRLRRAVPDPHGCRAGLRKRHGAVPGARRRAP